VYIGEYMVFRWIIKYLELVIECLEVVIDWIPRLFRGVRECLEVIIHCSL